MPTPGPCYELRAVIILMVNLVWTLVLTLVFAIEGLPARRTASESAARHTIKVQIRHQLDG